jgi:hypothetical protein
MVSGEGAGGMGRMLGSGAAAGVAADAASGAGAEDAVHAVSRCLLQLVAAAAEGTLMWCCCRGRPLVT